MTLGGGAQKVTYEYNGTLCLNTSVIAGQIILFLEEDYMHVAPKSIIPTPVPTHAVLSLVEISFLLLLTAKGLLLLFKTQLGYADKENCRGIQRKLLKLVASGQGE